MAREPMQMNQRPDMPDMAGANMSRQRGDAPVDDRTMNAAQENVKNPSEKIAAVLVARLGGMTEEQLAELDRAITPEAAKALLMLLPELGALMKALAESGEAGPMPQRPAPQAGPQMGALGAMS